MPRDDTFERDVGYLVDMLENAKVAISRVEGKTWDAFLADQLLRDAVTYRLGVVGEAARLVKPETRDLLPNIPWRAINSMRNILIHDYKGVEAKHVWDVSQVHAPALVDMIEAFLKGRGIRPKAEPGT